MEKGLMLRKVDEFARTGKTAEEIAELVGMSERAVRNTMAMYHIKVRKPAPSCPPPAMRRLMGGK